MTYELLMTDLTYPKSSLRRKFEKFEEYDIYVPDNYDQHDSFGFDQGDIDNAFSHACRMIDQMLQQNGRKRNLCKEQLVSDWKNYLLGLYQWETVDDTKTDYLMRALLYLRMDQVMYEQIMLYHQEYREELDDNKRGDGPYHKSLDFPELYEKHGDYLLFQKGNPELALKFYELAALNWSKYEDTKKNPWYKRYQEYRFYFQGIIPLKMQESKKDIFEKLFLEVQTMFHEYIERDDILVKTNEFFREYTSFVRKQTSVNELRRVLFMAYRLREQGLPFALYFLEREPKDTIETYWKPVLACLRSSNDEDMEVLRQYIDREKRKIDSDYPLFFRVLLLNKTMLYVRDAKECLAADDSGGDIAYYTSLETFSYMLPGKDGSNLNTGKLSIMNISYMNDPTEGQMLKRYLLGDKKVTNNTYRGRKDATYPYVFMKCFTTLIDDLPMWEMYGDHAKGCCIVLKHGRFIQNGGYRATVPLYRICYLRVQPTAIELLREDNQHIENFDALVDYMENIKQIVKDDPTGRRWYLKILSEIQYLFKNADYHHEQELRIIYQYHHWERKMMHTAGEYPKLYIQPEFHPDILEIILGPKFENRADKMPYLQEQVERMCEKTGGIMSRITLSSIEYR